MLRNSSTYVYLAILVGLLCYLTFIDNKKPGTKEQEASEGLIVKVNTDDITDLEITNPHGDFIFKKVNNRWKLRKPVDALADGTTIQGVLDQIANTPPQRTIPLEGNDSDTARLKDWGLNPATDQVVFQANGKKYSIFLGRKTATSDSVYARVDAGKNGTSRVMVVPHMIKEVVEKDLSDFRSRDVFDFEPDKVIRIATRTSDTATNPGQQCEIDLKDGKWSLQMPLVARASENDVQLLLNKALALHVVDFVSDDATNLIPYGLTSPSATFSITTKSDDKTKPEDNVVLQIGGPVPNKPDQVYAQRLKSNSVFTLTRASVDDLFRAAPNVRDRHVLPFDPGRATSLSYTIGPKKVQIRSDKSSWSTEGEYPGRADIAHIANLLARLSQLETTPTLRDSAPDLKAFGLDKPTGKIVIQSPEFKPGPSLTLLIGKTENKLTYVRNSVEPFVYTLPADALDFLPANNLGLRDPQAIQIDPRTVTGMTVTASPLPPIALTRSTGGTWTAQNVKDRTVNALKADAQVSLFCRLQAKTWLGPVLPAYGLAKPVLTIAVQNEKKPVILQIGAELPDGGRAAIVEGEPAAFEISPGDYGIFNASSIDLIPGSETPATTNAAPVAPAPATNAPAAKKDKAPAKK